MENSLPGAMPKCSHFFRHRYTKAGFRVCGSQPLLNNKTFLYFFRKLAKGEIARRLLTIPGMTSITRSISAWVL